MQKLILPTFMLAFWYAIILLFVACGNRPHQDVACYSGGILVWKGSVSKLNSNVPGCFEYVDSNGVAGSVCGASCFFSDSEQPKASK